MSLELEWKSLWCAAGGKTSPVYPLKRLVERYSEPHRHYHTLDHISHCLWELDPDGGFAHARNGNVVKMVVWYHDAVYDPRAHDNEERSAEIATTVLDVGGFPEEFIARVATLVRATAHTTGPKDDDEAVLIDVDLAILGQRADVFDEYEKQIRREYEFVPEEMFRTKRAEILRRFLERPHIYHTASMRHQYELLARQNLEHSIEQLTGVRIVRP